MNSKIVLTLVIGLLVGGLVGRLSAPVPGEARGPASIDAAPQESGARASVSPSEGEDAELVSSPGTGERTPATAAAAGAPVVPEGLIEDAMARAPEPAGRQAEGEGTIEGRVVGVDGQPVPGVLIRVASSEPYDPLRSLTIERREAPNTRSLRDHLDVSAQNWANSRASSNLVTSDAQGAFRVEGLDPAKDLFVRGYLDDHAIEGPNTRTRAGDTVELTARRIVQVDVTVLDASGASVDEAFLVIKKGNRTEMARWTSAARVIELLEGSVELQAALGVDVASHEWQFRGVAQSSSALSEPVQVEVRAGVEPVTLRLSESDRIEVLLALASPLPDEFDGSLVLTDSSRPEHDFDTRHYKRIRSGDRSASFGGLTPGSYRIRLDANGQREYLAETIVDFAGGHLQVELVVPELIVRTPARIRVQGPDGSAVEDVRFMRYVRRGSRTNGSGLRSEWVGDGWYETDLLPRVAVAGGDPTEEPFDEQWLEVSHPEHGTERVSIVDGQDEYLVTFAPSASLDVEIAGWDTSQMRGARLSLSRLDPEGGAGLGHHGRGERIDGDGTCTVEGIDPGNYLVVMEVDGQPWAREEITLVAGANQVLLTLGTRYTVEIHAPNLDQGTSLMLVPAGQGEDRFMFRSRLSAQIDDSNVATFENVLGGTYHLRNEFHSETIEVPCGRITIDARMPDALRVTIYEEDCLLARLGLEDGDLIIGFNGEVFDGIVGMSAAMQNLAAQELTLLVERDGAEIEVVAPGNLGGLPGLQVDGGAIGLATRE